jgi:hypothetical protein
MFTKIKATWTRLKRREPGERFQAFYRSQRRKPAATRVAFVGLAIVSFAIAVVLMFIPGPAVAFYALSAALFSTQSQSVARALDRAEVSGRKSLTKVRAWWRHLRGRRERARKTGHAG